MQDENNTREEELLEQSKEDVDDQTKAVGSAVQFKKDKEAAENAIQAIKNLPSRQEKKVQRHQASSFASAGFSTMPCKLVAVRSQGRSLPHS